MFVLLLYLRLWDCQSDHVYRNIVNSAGMVTPDGIACGLVGEIKRKFNNPKDLRSRSFERIVCLWTKKKVWRHFFYGGNDRTLQLLTKKLKQEFPKLQIVGTYAPSFKEHSKFKRRRVNYRFKSIKQKQMLYGLDLDHQSKIIGCLYTERNCRFRY